VVRFAKETGDENHKVISFRKFGLSDYDTLCSIVSKNESMVRSKMYQIDYEINGDLTVKEFAEILNNSTLGERRSVDDRECIEGMVKNVGLTVCKNKRQNHRHCQIHHRFCLLLLPVRSGRP